MNDSDVRNLRGWVDEGLPDDPQHPFWNPAGLARWPAWVEEFRPHQLTATQDLLWGWLEGKQVMFLDAPTGAGKTLIGEMVRRAWGTRGLYVCHSKSLQDQFAADFPYAQVLKGRANYPTELNPRATGGDCTGRDCLWCSAPDRCPYQAAKTRFVAGDVGVVNTAYLLAETRAKQSACRAKGEGGVVVVDESDTLEGVLMGAVEVRVSSGQMGRLGVDPVKKSARVKTVEKWMLDVAEAARERRKKLAGDSLEMQREKKRLGDLASRLTVAAGELGDDDGWGDWVRDYDDDDSFILKPVVVDKAAGARVWRHGDRWLCMSATLISAQEQAESLGLEGESDGDSVDWGEVTVPMQFPVEHRPIRLDPAADITTKNGKDAWDKVADKVIDIAERRVELGGVLVHTVSYALTRWIGQAAAKSVGGKERYQQGRGWTVKVNGVPWRWYSRASDRDGALDAFKVEGGVLLAPSMDRGVDLPGDLCRTQLIAKMPYLYLGDRQVQERMKRVGGQTWYQVQTARSLVQATGRGVRNADDWCDTWILDGQFSAFWRGGGRRLLPEWWRDAIR